MYDWNVGTHDVRLEAVKVNCKYKSLKRHHTNHTRVETIATRVEAIASKLEAMLLG